MKKRLLSLLLAVVLCIGLLPVGAGAADVEINTDLVDKDGRITTDAGYSRSGSVYTGSGTSDTIDDERWHIVQGSVTVEGDLTLGGGGGLVLDAGATLTVNGALILKGSRSNSFHIYGKTGDSETETGKLVINNTGDGAAIRSESTGTLTISSGKLEINSTSGELVKNVKLNVSNTKQEDNDSCTVMKATRTDASGSTEELKYEDWAGCAAAETDLKGSKLVIEYCKHEHYDDQELIKDTGTTHRRHCKVCGFTWASEECNFENPDHCVRNPEDDANTHIPVCECGNQGTPVGHTSATVPTANGQKHISGCAFCDWTEGGESEHDFSDGDGSCKECGITPIMRDSDGDLYDKENYKKAFEKAANSNGEVTLTLVSEVTGEDANTWSKTIEFNYPGKSVTLDMGGITLVSTGQDAALTVSGGELIIADNATLKGANGVAEMSATPAVKVTGGKLTFKGAVNATGGGGNSSAAAAIEVTGGKVIFEGDVTATGGLQGTAGNKLTRFPAIEATGGELDFGKDEKQVALDLMGGLTLANSATLTHGLTQGKFYSKSADSTASVSGDVLSVEDSSVYKKAYNLLADGYAFAVTDESAGENITYAGRAKTEARDVTIIAHTHFYDPAKSYVCACGEACTHSTYENGKCAVCGKPCEHYDVSSAYDHALQKNVYTCDDCKQQMYVQNTFGSRDELSTYKFAYFTNLKDAMAAAGNGWTVTLLDDVAISRSVDIYDENDAARTITLELNGKKITGSAPIWIGKLGRYPEGDIISPTTLKITGSGDISVSLQVAKKATLDLTGWTGGTINTVSVSRLDDSEGTLIVGENSAHINNLNCLSGPARPIANVKLRGGSYNNIGITMNSPSGANKIILFGSLLEPGYAFQYTESGTEPGEFLSYATKADYGIGGGNISNVKVVKCTTHVDAKSVDKDGNITDGTDGKCDYCNADLTKDAVATLTVNGSTYYYTDLQSALQAASSKGGTVTLQKDVENVSNMLVIEGIQPVTLDLNGKTISGSGSQSTLLGISNLSRVTICDSGTGGKIECTASGYAVYVSQGCDLTITGGTFAGANGAQASYAAGVNDAKLIITGGTFSSPVVIQSGGRAEISGGTFASLITYNGAPISSLLADGYGFQVTGTTTWLTDTELANTTATNITAVEAPIKAINIQTISTTEMGEDGRPVTVSPTMEYGTSGNVKLYATIQFAKGAGYTDKWYTVSADGTATEITDNTDTGYTLPADLAIGEHTYRITATAGDYSKSADITITVTKIDLANAAVTIDPWPTDGKVTYFPGNSSHSVLFITNGVVNSQIIVNGEILNSNEYTYDGATTTEGVGTYTLTITATDACAKYKGSKTFKWEVVPFTLPAPEFVGSQTYTKTYDGTTALPKAYTFYAGFPSVGTNPRVELATGDYEVSSASFVSADAGENKPINQKITLKSKNFVFASTEAINIEGITTTDKTITYTNWTPTTAYPSVGTTFNIEKADVDMTDAQKTVSLEVVNDLEYTYTVDLPELPTLESPKTYGNITYSDPAVNLRTGYITLGANRARVEDGKLILTIDKNNVTTTGSIGDVKVTVTTDNYEDVELIVNVTAVNKPQPAVFVTVPTDIVYGTTLADIQLKANAFIPSTGEPVPGTIAWVDDLAIMPQVDDTREFRWTFTPDDTEHYRAVTSPSSLKVKPADLIGQPTFEKITQSGKTLEDVNVDLDNVYGVTGNTVSPADFQWDDGKTTVIQPNKSYSWTISPSKNYKPLTGSVVLYPVSSGYSDQVKKQIEEFEAKKRGELPESDSSFRDVSEDDYFFDAVQWAAENGITGGVGANRFGPSQDCSRGQTMTFLWRAMGEPEPGSYDPALADVPAGSYFHDAVHWAMGEGVTTGAGKGIFAPDKTVTRGQFVTFLYRLANASSDGVHPFADVPAGSYYEKAIAWAYAEGITKGISATKFAPDAPCTRAQIITFLYRYFNR